MTAAATVKRKKPERLLLTVGRGALLPGDGYTQMRLRERGYKLGDILLADLRKPRNPGFHRLAHRLGTLVANNIDDFTGMDGHQALKRLQIEGNIACDDIALNMVIMGQKIRINQHVPRSLSFSSMDEGEFRETVQAFCRFIASEYWPGLTAEQVEAMAESMPESV